MIVLYTDFGLSSPYVGQMKAVLARGSPFISSKIRVANARINLHIGHIVPGQILVSTRTNL